MSQAFQNNDYELLNNAIYHYSKHRLLDLKAGGYDHCLYFWNVMDSMACNYKEAVEKCFPEELGLWMMRNGDAQIIKNGTERVFRNRFIVTSIT